MLCFRVNLITGPKYDMCFISKRHMSMTCAFFMFKNGGFYGKKTNYLETEKIGRETLGQILYSLYRIPDYFPAFTTLLTRFCW